METPNGVVYLMKWNEYLAPKALYRLQIAGLRTKVATKKFTYTINGKPEDFSYGTIQIPVKNQSLPENELRTLITRVANETGLDFYCVSTGLSEKGIDWGSNSFVNLEKPSVLVMVGGSVRSGEAGEIWHLFDQRYQVPVTIAETDDLNSVNLENYNAVVLPGGSYREWGNSETAKIKEWMQQGGTLIACKSAAAWASRNNLGKTQFKKNTQRDTTQHYNYAERNKESSLNTISGAIFETSLDLSHPLCFGYTEKTLPVFKTGTTVAEPLGENYAEPVKFTGHPYLSGFISNKNLERLINAPVVSVQSIGRGKLISYHEDMNFRGIWLGTAKLFSNAVFFGGVIR